MNKENNLTIQKMLSAATSKVIKSHVSLELGDIESIINAEGLVSTFSSTGRGKDAQIKSIQPLIESYRDCKDIRAMLICFNINETFSILKIKEAIDKINEIFYQNEEIIFSILIDNGLAVDEVQVNSIIKQAKVA